LTDGSARLEALLQTVRLFAALDRVELARLVGALEEEQLAAGDVLFEEGSESDGMYLVQSGRVQLTVRAPEGQRVFREVREGMHFGEVGILLGRNTVSATARTGVAL
jgi:CRP-like cAMP-binding protein